MRIRVKARGREGDGFLELQHWADRTCICLTRASEAESGMCSAELTRSCCRCLCSETPCLSYLKGAPHFKTDSLSV